ADVVRGITEKMGRRHPHVFGDARVSGSAEVLRNWEQIKAAEKQAADEPPHVAALARVPKSLPALLRAQRLGEKAAKGHVDATSLADVLGKVSRAFGRLEEEVRGLGPGTAPAEVARQVPADLRTRLDHGLGELLFNLC